MIEQLMESLLAKIRTTQEEIYFFIYHTTEKIRTSAKAKTTIRFPLWWPGFDP
jgi:hypothetical protein